MLGSICSNSLSDQERWCVVMGSWMLHPELTASVFGVAHAHGLQVEDVNLDEIVGC